MDGDDDTTPLPGGVDRGASRRARRAVHVLTARPGAARPRRGRRGELRGPPPHDDRLRGERPARTRDSDAPVTEVAPVGAIGRPRGERRDARIGEPSGVLDAPATVGGRYRLGASDRRERDGRRLPGDRRATRPSRRAEVPPCRGAHRRRALPARDVDARAPRAPEPRAPLRRRRQGATPYLVLELVDGPSLAERLATSGPVDAEEPRRASWPTSPGHSRTCTPAASCTAT